MIRDDCSTDNTVNILKEYEEKYSFIKVYFNECNRGCNQNFHDTIYQASGDYIAISDQDDIWFPTKIEKQMKKIMLIIPPMAVSAIFLILFHHLLIQLYKRTIMFLCLLLLSVFCLEIQFQDIQC